MASIYVSTFGRYSEGSLYGAWVHLSDFENKADFLAYCYEMHGDENDPELYFQDYQDLPDSYVSESDISSDIWDVWLELGEDEKDMLLAYLELVDVEGTISDARDACYGQWDSWEDFIESYVEDTGMLADVPEDISRYFDLQAFGRDMSYDFAMSRDGYVFANC